MNQTPILHFFIRKSKRKLRALLCHSVIFCHWPGNTNRDVVEQFTEQANKHQPTIKFTAQTLCRETTFSDTTIYKGERFDKESFLSMRTHLKPTETYHYSLFTTWTQSTCHLPGVKKGFVKGEALRLPRTNSLKGIFEDNVKEFKTQLYLRGYLNNFINSTLSEVKLE